MTLDELLLIPYERIDYEHLDGAMLLELATQQYEPFIATSALGELRVRRAVEAREASLAILASERPDRHLRSFALTTLCEVDQERAIEEMAKLVDQSQDPKILGAMVECALANVERFQAEDTRHFVHRLAERLAAVSPDEFTDLDERASFLKIFDPRRQRSGQELR